MSGGLQQMLSIARAPIGGPQCLEFDEPGMGLAPLLVQQIFDVVKGLTALHVTALLVEQNAFGALPIANFGDVMENWPPDILQDFVPCLKSHAGRVHHAGSSRSRMPLR